jgi:hypothetical protein
MLHVHAHRTGRFSFQWVAVGPEQEQHHRKGKASGLGVLATISGIMQRAFPAMPEFLPYLETLSQISTSPDLGLMKKLPSFKSW